MIWPALGAFVDLLHSLLMAAWVIGFPLLVWHRWPRLTRAYCVYSIAFVILNQVSQALLGECFLTTIARMCWMRAPAGSVPTGMNEWFTVRLAQAIFHLTPTHRSIKLLSEILVVLTAVGVLVAYRRLSRHRTPPPETPQRPGAQPA